MLEVPPLDSIAAAAIAVGTLFLLRYFLVMRRILKGTGHVPSFQFKDYFRAMKPGAFGNDFEPERRYAKRQLVLCAVFVTIGLLLLAWLLATGTPIRLQG